MFLLNTLDVLELSLDPCCLRCASRLRISDKSDQPIGALSWATSFALTGANNSLTASTEYEYVGHGFTQHFTPKLLSPGASGVFTCTDGSESLKITYKGLC